MLPYVASMADGTMPTDLLAMLDALGCAIDGDVSLAEESIAEQRRQAHAASKHCKRDANRYANRYALGGTMMMLGFEPLDDTTLVGLFSHTDLMLRWLVEARVAHSPASFANLVGHVLADPARAAWCREWGGHLRWKRQKALYVAEVEAFVTSGRTGPRERWRRDPVTDGQAYLIDLICELRQVPDPTVTTKGAAFDWLYEAGGNPSYCKAPTTPGAWR